MKSTEEQPYCIVYRPSHGRELIWNNAWMVNWPNPLKIPVISKQVPVCYMSHLTQCTVGPMPGLEGKAESTSYIQQLGHDQLMLNIWLFILKIFKLILKIFMYISSICIFIYFILTYKYLFTYISWIFHSILASPMFIPPLCLQLT